jgi:hypothetical protein
MYSSKISNFHDEVMLTLNNKKLTRSTKFSPVSEVFVDGIEIQLPPVSKKKRESFMKSDIVSLDSVIKSATRHIEVHNILPKWGECT